MSRSTDLKNNLKYIAYQNMRKCSSFMKNALIYDLVILEKRSKLCLVLLEYTVETGYYDT